MSDHVPLVGLGVCAYAVEGVIVLSACERRVAVRSFAVACVLCVAMLLCLRGGSAAAQLPGGLSAMPARLAFGSLSAVSCVSNTVCTAVGATGMLLLSERWHRARWTVQHVPNPGRTVESRFLGLSCVGRKMCAAVGFSASGAGCSDSQNPSARCAWKPLVEFWNGHKWSIATTPTLRSRNYGFFSVSCVSPDFCMAVGYHGVGPGCGYPGSIKPCTPRMLAERWDGRRWSIKRTVGPGREGVSCTSKGACTAVGGGAAERWNGHGWFSQILPGRPMRDR